MISTIELLAAARSLNWIETALIRVRNSLVMLG